MTQTLVDKEKMNIIMIGLHAQMFTNNDRLLRNNCHNSKSDLLIKAVFHFSLHFFTLFLLFIQQPCQTIAGKIEISSILLVNEYFIYLFIYPTLLGPLSRGDQSNYSGGSSDTCLSLNNWTGYSTR